jgi:hypothetical protein
MAAQYLLQKRSFDGQYQNPYRSKAGVRYTAWKTISKHPELEEARATQRSAKRAGLVSYRIRFKGQTIE